MAQENDSIDIVIKKSSSAEGTSPSQSLNGETGVQKVEQGKLDYQKQAINTALIGQGKAMLFSGINIYADVTKNYRAIEKMNNVMGLAGDVLMIAKGGYVGAIAVVGKHTIEVASSFVVQRNADLEHQMALQKSGYISESGSR